VPDEPLLPLVPELPDVPEDPELPEVPLDPLVPELPLVPDEPLVPDTPINPPGVIFLLDGIIEKGEAFPAYPRFVKVTEVELPIALTEKYPALS
jgi:thrombospondin-related uncharacterized protein